MKKLIVAFIALIFLLVVACGDTGTAQAKDPEIATFDTIENDGSFAVIRHNETGVCYLRYNAYQEGGLTLMVNPDGTPYVWGE